MPLGRGDSVDFDAVYTELLEPAIREAHLDPLRVPGVTHVRAADPRRLRDRGRDDGETRTSSTSSACVTPCARLHRRLRRGRRMPPASCPTRSTTAAARRPCDRDRAAVVEALVAARDAQIERPVFQLLGDSPRPEIDRLKTDVFRERAAYSIATKERLAAARADGHGGGARAGARARACRGSRSRSARRPAALLPRDEGVGRHDPAGGDDARADPADAARCASSTASRSTAPAAHRTPSACCWT